MFSVVDKNYINIEQAFYFKIWTTNIPGPTEVSK